MISLSLLIVLGSTLLVLAEETEWIIYMKLVLWLIVFQGLAEFVHKLP